MTDYVDTGLKDIGITISKPKLAAACIIFGILVIMFPKLLVWIVGFFLVVQGMLLFTDPIELERSGTIVTLSKGVHCSHRGTSSIEESLFCEKCGRKLEQVREKKNSHRTKSAYQTSDIVYVL